MRRHYLRVYLAFLGIVVLFCIFSSIAWMVAHPREEERRVFEGVGEIVAELLPAADRPKAELQHAVERLGEKLGLVLTVRGADGALLASVGEPLPAPRGNRSGWAYPIARRITGRLERLQESVDQLGAGDLTTRVDVEGKDEVAQLARSFNRAADRIERLVNAQQTMLTSASHELRSPLARMRVAIELLAGDDRPELRDQISRDIAELDELIGEILLASRLDTLEELERTDEVDILALVAEEGARVRRSRPPSTRSTRVALAFGCWTGAPGFPRRSGSESSSRSIDLPECASPPRGAWVWVLRSCGESPATTAATPAVSPVKGEEPASRSTWGRRHDAHHSVDRSGARGVELGPDASGEVRLEDALRIALLLELEERLEVLRWVAALPSLRSSRQLIPTAVQHGDEDGH